MSHGGVKRAQPSGRCSRAYGAHAGTIEGGSKETSPGCMYLVIQRPISPVELCLCVCDSGNKLGPEGAQALVAALMEMKQLQQLNLGSK